MWPLEVNRNQRGRAKNKSTCFMKKIKQVESNYVKANGVYIPEVIEMEEKMIIENHIAPSIAKKEINSSSKILFARPGEFISLKTRDLPVDKKIVTGVHRFVSFKNKNSNKTLRIDSRFVSKVSSIIDNKDMMSYSVEMDHLVWMPKLRSSLELESKDYWNPPLKRRKTQVKDNFTGNFGQASQRYSSIQERTSAPIASPVVSLPNSQVIGMCSKSLLDEEITDVVQKVAKLEFREGIDNIGVESSCKIDVFREFFHEVEEEISGSTMEDTRCYARKLLVTCIGQCGKLLTCGSHWCQETCHVGPCGFCQVSANASCFCKKKTEVIPCGDIALKGEFRIESGVFSCNAICAKDLSCENHKCCDTCHPDPYGEYSLLPNKITTCCCGKSSLKEARQSCLDPIPTCSELCNRTLPCKLHTCQELCHTGDCAPCHVSVSKKCLCGSTSRTVDCFITVAENGKFTCDGPCGQKKSCGRHRCSEHGHYLPCLETIFKDLICACGRTSLYPPLSCGSSSERKASCIHIYVAPRRETPIDEEMDTLIKLETSYERRLSDEGRSLAKPHLNNDDRNPHSVTSPSSYNHCGYECGEEKVMQEEILKLAKKSASKRINRTKDSRYSSSFTKFSGNSEMPDKCSKFSFINCFHNPPYPDPGINNLGLTISTKNFNFIPSLDNNFGKSASMSNSERVSVVVPEQPQKYD